MRVEKTYEVNVSRLELIILLSGLMHLRPDLAMKDAKLYKLDRDAVNAVKNGLAPKIMDMIDSINDLVEMKGEDDDED